MSNTPHAPSVPLPDFHSGHELVNALRAKDFAKVAAMLKRPSAIFLSLPSNGGVEIGEALEITVFGFNNHPHDMEMFDFIVECVFHPDLWRGKTDAAIAALGSAMADTITRYSEIVEAESIHPVPIDRVERALDKISWQQGALRHELRRERILQKPLNARRPIPPQSL